MNYPNYPDIYAGEHFYPGQFIKCIDDRKIELYINKSKWQDLGEYLEMNKIYKVTKFELVHGRAKVWIIRNGSESWYYPDRFISILKEERKSKLKKLMSYELGK